MQLKVQIKNLSKNKQNLNIRNFEGTKSELCYPGGELTFIRNMIIESNLIENRNRILWFTSLISKQTNVYPIQSLLETLPGLKQYHIVDMSHGNKKSRIIAWTFQSLLNRNKWTAEKVI